MPFLIQFQVGKTPRFTISYVIQLKPQAKDSNAQLRQKQGSKNTRSLLEKWFDTQAGNQEQADKSRRLKLGEVKRLEKNSHGKTLTQGKA